MARGLAQGREQQRLARRQPEGFLQGSTVASRPDHCQALWWPMAWLDPHERRVHCRLLTPSIVFISQSNDQLFKCGEEEEGVHFISVVMSLLDLGKSQQYLIAKIAV